MNAPIRLLVFSITALVIPAAAAAHGGAYRGPGGGGPADTVSPGPSADQPTDRSAGTPGPHGVAGSGTTCNPGSGATSSPGATPAPPPSLAAPSSADATVWQVWWGYNQDAYLGVKAAIHSGELLSGSDDFFLGNAPVDRARDRLVPSAHTVRARIAPALVRVLETERDNDIVTGAIVALAKIGDSARIPVHAVIRPFLADANQEIAETAAVALGILASPDSAPMLVALLQDSPEGRELVGRKATVPTRTRAFAAFGLGLIGNRVEDPALRREVARALVAVVEGEGRRLASPDVSVACLSSLGLIELPSDPDFVLGPGDPTASRQALVVWLLEVGSDATHRDLVRAHAPTAAARVLSHEDADLRAHAASTWITALERSSGSPRELQQSAVLALGEVGCAGDDPSDRAIRAALLEASLSGHGVEVKNFAKIALAEVAGRGDGGPGLRLVRNHLLAELDRGASTSRPWAALGLGVLGRRLGDAGRDRSLEVDRALARALSDARAPRDVGACAIAIGLRRDIAASGVLLTKLDSTADDDARGYVALALGMIGAVEGLGDVHGVVRASKYRPELLRQAAISLGLLGDKGVVPDLISMLKDAQSLSAQASLAYGLGAIGDARSVRPLVEMLQDGDITPRGRAFAAVALGIVADKEQLPWNAKLAAGINYRANTTTLTDGRGTGILEIL